jgi:hypothetical protein
MQVNFIEELITDLDKIPGIPDQVRGTAIIALRQGIVQQLDIFKQTLLDGVQADMQVRDSNNMSKQLTDVCMRMYSTQGRQDGPDALHYHRNLLLENPLLFDQCLQSSIENNNVHDVMQLMRLRLSSMSQIIV